MTEKTTTTTAFKRVLDELVESRGLKDLDELKERLLAAGHKETANALPEDAPGGFGEDLDAVLNLSEEEKLKVADAFAATFMGARCSVPGCERPLDPNTGSFRGCTEHRAAYDAQADEEAWEYAHSLLLPMVELARGIGSDELTRVMDKALAEVEGEVNRTNDILEALQERAGD
jgi:hypothetical protein